MFKYFLFIIDIKEDRSEIKRKEGHLGAEIRAPEVSGHYIHGWVFAFFARNSETVSEKPSPKEIYAYEHSIPLQE